MSQAEIDRIASEFGDKAPQEQKSTPAGHPSAMFTQKSKTPEAGQKKSQRQP